MGHNDTMLFGELPDWCRVLLLFLSVVSFLPQLGLLVVGRTSSGISPFYLLFNLISATEQFTQYSSVFVVVLDWHDSEGFVHNPPSRGDWINLAHFAVVWAMWLVIFSLSSKLSPENLGRHVAALVIYLAYLLISIIPEFLYAFGTWVHPEERDTWMPALFTGMHMFYVVPATTVLCIAAVLLQAREVRSRPPGSPPVPLSTVGLGLQAVVFALVAISWLARLPWPGPREYESLTRAALIWFSTVSWHTVNDGIFAAGQAVLLRFVFSGNGAQSVADDGGETEPLLGRIG